MAFSVGGNNCVASKCTRSKTQKASLQTIHWSFCSTSSRILRPSSLALHSKCINGLALLCRSLSPGTVLYMLTCARVCKSAPCTLLVAGESSLPFSGVHRLLGVSHLLSNVILISIIPVVNTWCQEHTSCKLDLTKDQHQALSNQAPCAFRSLHLDNDCYTSPVYRIACCGGGAHECLTCGSCPQATYQQATAAR